MRVSSRLGGLTATRQSRSTEREVRTMKFTCQVETSSSLNPVQPAAGKAKPGRNWDIQVRVDQVRLVSEPPANDVEKLIFADQTTRASEPPPIFENQISTTASSHTSKKSISQSSSSTMSTSMKSSSQTSTTVSSKKSVSSRNVQINVGSKKKSVAAMTSSLSMAEERKLSKLLNPRGRKVTRQGDWLVFTEKVGILTSQNGVQQVREERVKINSEDLDRLVGLGF